MKTRLLMIIVGIAIALMLAGIFGYQKIYESRCLEEGGTMTSFLSCRVVFMDFATDPNAELKQKMQKLIAEEKNNPTRPGHSYVRIAIDSDELTFDEKLQALKIYYNEESTGEPTFDNVMTGKDRFEYQEPITFTWKQFGWGFPCPKISIQDELQVDQYNREVLYQERIVYPCPYSEGNSAFLFTFTEQNLPDFPPCTVSGKHVISVKDQFNQWFPLHEYRCNAESKPEPITKSIITVRDRLPERTIVPITITEITTNAESLDEIAHWNFSLLGIEMESLGDYWGNLPNQYIENYMVDDNGNDVLDYSRIPEGMIFYKLSLLYYPAVCEDGQQIKGEGLIPEPIPIKIGSSSVFFKSGSVGLYPDNDGKYSLEFVSGFETEIEFHPNIEVISQETKKCNLEVERGNFTDIYYTNAVFSFE